MSKKFRNLQGHSDPPITNDKKTLTRTFRTRTSHERLRFDSNRAKDSSLCNSIRLPMSAQDRFYPVGQPLTPWGDAERAAWLKHVGQARRSYADDVIASLATLRHTFDVVQYGALSQDPNRYPLFCVKSRDWDPRKLIRSLMHFITGAAAAIVFSFDFKF